MLRRAVGADDTYGPARNNLGLAHFKLGRLYEAAWEFEAAIRLMPGVPEPRNNLGLVLERAGKLDGAVEAFQKARDLDPDRPEYLGNLLRARVRRGDAGDAIRPMLEQFLLTDLRPQWQQWARAQLHRAQSAGTQDAPNAETHSAADPSPPGGPVR